MHCMNLTSRAAAFALTLAVACDNSTAPRSQLAGGWDATTFTTTENGVTTNQLGAGAALTLDMDPTNAVVGSLTIPSQNVNEVLAGTYTLNGNTVTFSMSADTFVRDMPFTLENDTLVGDKTFAGVRVQVTLTHTHPWPR